VTEPEPNAGDVALACVSVFVDQLATQGMRHASVSPGSRSTPIALAFYRHPSIAVHVHLDERASAFFALGIAKATGTPVAVACTSGTAAAEFLPAVVEAEMSHAPLLLLTADRPPELRGTGANQTIDQRELFGPHARAFIQAEVPAEDEGSAAYWRTLGARAMTIAAHRPAGPVHVNLPFREPLTPRGADVHIGRGRWNAEDVAIPVRISDEEDDEVHELATSLHHVDRGLVLAGGLPIDRNPGDVSRLAAALGWPVVAEPTSQLRRPGAALAAGQLLLANEKFARDHRPEVVLQFGAAPTSRASQILVGHCERLIVVQSPGLRADPQGRADATILWDHREIPAMLADASSTRTPTPRAWFDAWRSADTLARNAVDALLDGWDEPFEGRVARDLAAAVPAGGTLIAGSSMPIRDLDMFMAPREHLRALANRGASGIDGVLSTALGVAAAGDGPTYALIGDLSLLHDAGSFVWSGRRDLDLIVVVPNNDGGVIFSYLDQRALPEHECLFTTPHGLDLGALAAAARVPFARVEHGRDLAPALEDAANGGGIRLVEVAIPRELDVVRHGEVHEVLADALAAS
jgi:2-succinyl-5-enolpyruvyl-6-hydroxy-3-cyclohexene-1-carboxylate synthase